MFKSITQNKLAKKISEFFKKARQEHTETTDLRNISYFQQTGVSKNKGKNYMKCLNDPYWGMPNGNKKRKMNSIKGMGA